MLENALFTLRNAWKGTEGSVVIKRFYFFAFSFEAGASFLKEITAQPVLVCYHAPGKEKKKWQKVLITFIIRKSLFLRRS